IAVTIDGADEVDELGNLIKGGGGALTREKIVAAASRKEIIIIDDSKLVKTLGRFPLPVEVLPFGWQSVAEKLKSFDCQVDLRTTNGQAFLTDNQNYVIDCKFDGLKDLNELAQEINAIPGVVENGLFLGLTDAVIVGREDGSVEERLY
ncbi:MAG: ribose 5-phosphate isomerase A, partial [bacterium]